MKITHLENEKRKLQTDLASAVGKLRGVREELENSEKEIA